MTLSNKELQRLRSIDEQAEMLAQQRIAKHHQDILDGNRRPEETKVVSLKDFNIYKCFIPLPEQNDKLECGCMYSYTIPTGEEFLEVTPIDSIELSAEEHQEEKGLVDEDIVKAAFNSYQDCRHNPNLITFEKMTKDEIRETFQDIPKENFYGEEN